MQIKKIVKRTGDVVAFNETKITDAIRKANLDSADTAMTESAMSDLTAKVIDVLLADGVTLPTVEQIQDTVEKILIAANFANTAKSYIIYRAEHAKIRKSEGDLMQIYNELTFKKSEDADIKRENANIDADTAMGTMLKYGSEGSKYFIDHYILPRDIAAAHINGDLHIHDKDFYMLTETCCQIDLLKLFKNGFSTGHGYLREPNSIQSYSALACIAIQANQNEMHGGQSIPNFDYSMAPGIAKTFRHEYYKALVQFFIIKHGLSHEKAADIVSDIRRNIGFDVRLGNLSEYQNRLISYLSNSRHAMSADAERAHNYAAGAAERETDRAAYQSMEAFIHNLNTMNSRAGAQVPFSSVNYGTDTSPEARMVIKNLLLATESGLGGGETPIFPVQIFKVKEGINYNEGDPNYDLFKLAMRTSAKRLFPNFSFIDAPFNLQYYRAGDYDSEVAYMGCRTRVIGNVHDRSKEVTCGRGNLSFTTVNLPRLAIEARGDMKKFYASLNDMIDMIIRQLLHRFKIQCTKRGRNYPFLMGQGIWIDSTNIGPDDTIAEVLKHGTLSMGFIGLAETLKALTGFHHGESDASQRLGLDIVTHMRNRMDEQSAKTGLNFTLLATPAEGLSGRFVRIDRKRYGVIPGITDRDYYTNSFHVPVYYNIKAFKKISLEAPYHELTNAGHISYVELDGDTCKNLAAFEAIVRYMKQSGIGYGSVNHPVDRDPVCGYNGIIDDICPKCHRSESDATVKFERIRRITGYLVGTTERFNNAKRAEEHDRVKHVFND